MWRAIRVRLRSLWRWRRQESELDEEIRFHLAEEFDELVEGGMSPARARVVARRDFGNLPLIRERTRETWGWGAAERLLQDGRSAICALRRNPGYACAVVLTLALGIGLNASMYTLLSRLFLQAPPHIEGPDEVHRVWVQERFRCDENGDPTAPMYTREATDWADFSALGADFDRFGALAGYTRPRPMQNGRGQRAEELQVSWVTGDLLALLGARPALGRPIVPEDDDVAAEPVAVIGNGYWRRRFDGTREALGATLTFGEITYTIVGVMPPGFAGPEPHAADVWLPLHVAATDARENWRDSCAGFSLSALLRLAPGATAEAAEATATSALRAARADSPWQDTEGAVVLGPVLPTRGPGRLGGDMLLPLFVGGVAGIVLLIGAANVTNLLMLRVAARRRELAVRHALGAGRWAVGRLLVIESLVLATVSGGAALALAAVASRVLQSTLLPEHQWAAHPPDVTAIAFTGVAALAVGLATAVAPAVGVDELSRRRGQRYLTLVYQIDGHRKRLLWIGRERKAETLEGFFDWFGAARSAGLHFVCSDMWKPYLKVVADRARLAVQVLDRFHIMSHLSQAIDEVRAAEARKLAAEGRAPVLKRSRWLLLKRPEKLTDDQRGRLRELVRRNLRTVRAYLLKEDFQSLWGYVSPYWAGQFLDRWCTRTMRSRLEPMKDVARMLRSHRELILNWFRARGQFSSGIVEGFNGKARVITKRAYGFRTSEALEVALYHALGDLPEPELTHRFC